MENGLEKLRCDPLEKTKNIEKMYAEIIAQNEALFVVLLAKTGLL